MRRARRGFTLTEALVASMLFLMVVGIAAQAAQLVRQNFYGRSVRVESRQDARQLMLELRNRLRPASYVFAGFSGALDGHRFAVPGPGQQGPDLVVAVPDNEPEDAYRLHAVYLRPRQPADPRVPDASQVVLLSASATPAVAALPGSLSLTGLTWERRVFDVYVPAGSLEFSLDPSGRTVTVDLWTQRVPLDGMVRAERHEFSYLLRNR